MRVLGACRLEAVLALGSDGARPAVECDAGVDLVLQEREDRGLRPGLALQGRSNRPIWVFTMVRSSGSRSTDRGVHDGPLHALEEAS